MCPERSPPSIVSPDRAPRTFLYKSLERNNYYYRI